MVRMTNSRTMSILGQLLYHYQKKSSSAKQNRPLVCLYGKQKETVIEMGLHDHGRRRGEWSWTVTMKPRRPFNTPSTTEKVVKRKDSLQNKHQKSVISAENRGKKATKFYKFYKLPTIFQKKSATSIDFWFFFVHICGKPRIYTTLALKYAKADFANLARLSVYLW